MMLTSEIGGEGFAQVSCDSKALRRSRFVASLIARTAES